MVISKYISGSQSKAGWSLDSIAKWSWQKFWINWTFWTSHKIWRSRQQIELWRWVKFDWFNFSLPFPSLHSFSVVCAKKSLTIITLFVFHHLRPSVSQKISDLRVIILFFTIYFSSLNKVYTKIQSWPTLLLKCKHYCLISKHYLSKYFFSLGEHLLENN